MTGGSAKSILIHMEAMLPHPNPTRPRESVPKDISRLENTYYHIAIDNYS